MAATCFESLQSIISFPSISYNMFIDEVDNADYRYEAVRLKSFKNWPAPYIDPQRLAAAGFYFTGEADIVQCFECHRQIYKWEEGDDPIVDHKKISPNCRFINKIPSDNVPIGADSNMAPLENRDVCGPYDRKCDVPYKSYHNPFLMNLQLTQAKYPKFESYESRFRTFDSWNKLMSPTKEMLSLAGFYYTGREDQVLCYHCGVGVKDWAPNDDPWEQHATWFPNCNYLLKVKGRNFANKITGEYSEDITSDLVEKEHSIDIKSKGMVDDICDPGQSSQSSESSDSSESSQESGIESMSNDSSPKGSIENLSDIEVGNSKSDARLCKICYSGELSKLFLPCCHLISCISCAENVKECPICRVHITGKIRVFFS